MSTTTPTPETRPGWWARLRAAVRYVLAMEPVTVMAVVRAGIVLVAAVGLTIPDWVEPRVSGVVVAFYALVELITSIRTKRRTEPSAAVVEVARDGVVVAGEASEIPTGQAVRPVGSLEGPFPQG